jgi:hypothetical protein
MSLGPHRKSKGKEINIFKSLARSNVFSTKSKEQRSKFGVA